MTDIVQMPGVMTRPAGHQSLHEPSPLLLKRNAAEARFKMYGIAAISVGLLFLLALFGTIVSKGYTAFYQTAISLDVEIKPEVVDPQGLRTADSVNATNIFGWDALINEALARQLGLASATGPEAKLAAGLLSKGARIELRAAVAANPAIIGTTQTFSFIADGNIDAFNKGAISADTPEDRRPVKDAQIAMIKTLQDKGAMSSRFNSTLFTAGGSSRPEQSGLAVALVGSLYMMLIVLALSLPVGVAASIYLEEFAKKNRFTDLIEVNINNLAAVPSIVFGILGLALFINFLGLPRSAPIVGGLVLSLMTLPTIIITTRAALKSVPPSIRQAALGVGASKMQTVFHHVLPLAMPGILTGTILGLAHAVGETAPLLLIGMTAFIADVPSTPFEPGTALPTQIYLWTTAAERAFEERTSAAILVLLAFMLLMNLAAIILRKRFERRW